MSHKMNFFYATHKERQSRDNNWQHRKFRMAPYADHRITTNGSDRGIDFRSDDTDKFYSDNGKIMPNNYFGRTFYRDNRGPTDVYSYYRFQEVPSGGWQPRLPADGAEYFESIQNKHFYRRENAYELQNRIIHPSHADEISPERMAADPHQVIHNYYKGLPDPSDRHTARVMEFSRQRTNARRHARKIKEQANIFIDGGDAHANDELEPLYW
jgi:hypothetical protein